MDWRVFCLTPIYRNFTDYICFSGEKKLSLVNHNKGTFSLNYKFILI